MSAGPAEKVAANDLSLYYSLLFAPAPQRTAVTVLYAFWLEVREIDRECSEPAIGRAKLAWWQEEIEAAFAGQPRHPIAVALAPVITTYRLTKQPFHELIEALARHIATSEYATFEDLREHARGTRGRLEQLATGVSAARVPGIEQRAGELGAILELVCLLREVGADARRGRVYLPRADLARFGIAAEELRTGRAAEPLRRLIAGAAGRLLHELDAGTANLSIPERRALLPLVSAAEIARRLLRKISNSPERVLRERVQLLPLAQLWIAWRTARAAA